MTLLLLRLLRPSCLAVSALLLLAACSPAFNWRDVRPDNSRLKLLLPCKPEKAQREVPLGGRPTALKLLGCDAGGATFALALATLDDASQASAVLAGWQTATLANMQAGSAVQTEALQLPGADAQPQALRVRAQGQRADGRVVHSQAVYFAQGRQVFQAVIYADTLAPDVADTFFSSLHFE